MPDRSGREVIEAFIDIQNRQDWDRLVEVLHPDYVEELPQSGERFRGIANARAQRENYPGGAFQSPVERRDLAGGEDRWVMTPAFTLIRVTGTSDRYTYVLRTRYPDGSFWFVVALAELRDGLIARSTLYFAPDFPAPDWRAPFRESIEPSGSRS